MFSFCIQQACTLQFDDNFWKNSSDFFLHLHLWIYLSWENTTWFEEILYYIPLHTQIWLWSRSVGRGGSAFLQDLVWFSVLCSVSELQSNVWLWRFLVWWMYATSGKFAVRRWSIFHTLARVHVPSSAHSCLCPSPFLKPLSQKQTDVNILSCTSLYCRVCIHTCKHTQLCPGLSVCLQTLCNCLVCSL